MSLVESLIEYGLPLAVAILAIAGLIYVYNDGKKERAVRQVVMDKQNMQWLALYKENLEESAKMRKEMHRYSEVITELKGVIRGLYPSMQFIHKQQQEHGATG
jgi:hypothetical protein